MSSAKMPLLITLFSCMGKGKNSYTKASVNKMRKLLKKRHDKEIKRRWTFQCLRDFEDAGLITRRVRIINNKHGHIAQLSSMIAFTLKGAKRLVAMKVAGSLLLLKRILDWMKNRDKRFPAGKDLLPATFDEIDPGEIEKLEHLALKVFKTI